MMTAPGESAHTAQSQQELARQVSKGFGVLNGFDATEVDRSLRERLKIDQRPMEKYTVDRVLKTNDEAVYIDPYQFNGGVIYDAKEKLPLKKLDPEFRKNVDCPLSDNELLTIRQIFTMWTGLPAEGISPDGKEYRDWTYEEMMNEMTLVRAFFRNELNRTFGLSGVLAEINQTMFMEELANFEEDDLMCYVSALHIDLSKLIDIQAQIDEQYSIYSKTDGVTPADLDERQDENLKIYLREMRAIILQFRIDLMDRLRLWRWREEVLLGRISDSLDVYPGVEIIYSYETAEELLSDGIENYYLRVGGIKRETLYDKYTYVDLYHMAGVLAIGYNREVKFTTDMQDEDLIDMIMTLLDEIRLDPRHILTPLGVQVIYNHEKGEVVFNLCNFPAVDTEALFLACSHAGIETVKETVYQLEEEDIPDVDEKGKEEGASSTERPWVVRRDEKPEYVLVEELACQYLSPQFFSGIETHRNYLSVLASFRTLSGASVLNAEESDIIFYGIGDGLSNYRVYTPRELADIFNSTKTFYDPYSIRKHPTNPLKWSSFSIPSIKRLMSIVIPRLKIKSKDHGKVGQDASNSDDLQEMRIAKRADLTFLEDVIMKNLHVLEREDPLTLDIYLKPKAMQRRLINELKGALDGPGGMGDPNVEKLDNPEETVDAGIRFDLASFFAYLFNLGVQFSDWDTLMTGIDETAIQVARDWEPDWKMVDPQTTMYLTDKIFTMLAVDTEKYINVSDPVTGDSYSRHIRNLRLVKYYLGAYRIDWDDELSTIGGHLTRMLEANKTSYYHMLKTSGNWLMATANYYSIAILGAPLASQDLQFNEELEQ